MARFMDFILIFAMHSLITKLFLNTLVMIDFKCNMCVNDNHFLYFGIKIDPAYGKIVFQNGSYLLLYTKSYLYI